MSVSQEVAEPDGSVEVLGDDDHEDSGTPKAVGSGKDERTTDEQNF